MLIALALAFVIGVILLGVFVLGAAVAWRGVQGHRVDDFPRCRACRYNLSGAPTRPDRCPECGENLLMPDTVRVGRREPRPRLIAAGAAISLVALSPALVPASRAVTQALTPPMLAAAPRTATPVRPRVTADPNRWIGNPALARASAEVKRWRRDGLLEAADRPLLPPNGPVLASLFAGDPFPALVELDPRPAWPGTASPSAKSHLWQSMMVGNAANARAVLSIIHPDGSDDLRATARGVATWAGSPPVARPAAADLGWTAPPPSPATIASGEAEAAALNGSTAPAKRRSRIGF